MADEMLPSNATAFERSFERAIAVRLDLEVTIADLRDPERCPEPYLAELARERGVVAWSHRWSEARKRALIREAPEINRRLGTRWAMLRALELCGFANAQIRTLTSASLDGSLSLDGLWQLSGQIGALGEYNVILGAPITLEQAEQVRSILRHTAPARAQLIDLIFEETSYLLDASMKLDGSWTLGGA